MNLVGVAGTLRRLVWVDREGRVEPIAAEPSEYAYPRISPARTHVALDDRNDDNDLWVSDLAVDTGRTRHRVTGSRHSISPAETIREWVEIVGRLSWYGKGGIRPEGLPAVQERTGLRSMPRLKSVAR